MNRLIILTLTFFTALFTQAEEQESSYFGYYDKDTGLKGFLYDLKTTYKNEPSELGESKNDVKAAYYEVLGSLIRKKFKQSELSKYLQAEESNYLKFLYIPTISAEGTTKEFGSAYIEPKQVVIVYEGIIEEAPEGKFRFAGVFDDVLCVMVNDKIVFYASYQEKELRYKPTKISNRRKTEGVKYMAFGKDITVRKGNNIKIILGEVPGGKVDGSLHFQMENVEYKKDAHDDPILHPFITDELTDEERKKLPANRFNLDKIPVFKFKGASGN